MQRVHQCDRVRGRESKLEAVPAGQCFTATASQDKSDLFVPELLQGVRPRPLSRQRRSWPAGSVLKIGTGGCRAARKMRRCRDFVLVEHDGDGDMGSSIVSCVLWLDLESMFAACL